MNLHGTTGVDERDNWRKRIARALQELRGADESLRAGHARESENGEDSAAESTHR